MQLSYVLSVGLFASAKLVSAFSYDNYEEGLGARDVYDTTDDFMDNYLFRRYVIEALKTRDLWRRATAAELREMAMKIQEQVKKCDDIKHEYDNVTPGPSQKAKKEALKAKLDACKNAYMQMKTKFDRMEQGRE